MSALVKLVGAAGAVVGLITGVGTIIGWMAVSASLAEVAAICLPVAGAGWVLGIGATMAHRTPGTLLRKTMWFLGVVVLFPVVAVGASSQQSLVVVLTFWGLMSLVVAVIYSPFVVTREIKRAKASTQVCPDCAERIKAQARVCRFCGYRFLRKERRDVWL
jgi:hypothetical protein